MVTIFWKGAVWNFASRREKNGKAFKRTAKKKKKERGTKINYMYVKEMKTERKRQKSLDSHSDLNLSDDD